MLTMTLLILAATQPLTLSGLVFTLFRLARMNPATVRSHVDLTLVGTVEEPFVELQEMTASALEKLAHQRVQIDALLRARLRGEEYRGGSAAPRQGRAAD